jgi:RimJ/RimL family protein N-acetyltransferase
MACIIAPENIASLRVAEKSGFRTAHRTTYRGEPTLMLYRDP